MILLYLFINATIILLFVWLCSRKYGTLLNPVGFFSGFYFISSVLAPYLFLQLGMFDDFDPSSIERTSVYSSLYFAGLGSTFLVKASPWGKLYGFLFRLTANPKPNRLAILSEFIVFLLVFLVLGITSGVGIEWITNTRDAYQYHRASVGIWWSLAQATLMLTYICALFRWGKASSRILLYVLIFAFLASFLGSKASMLAYPVIAVFFYHFVRKPLSTRMILTVSFILVMSTLALQIYQRTASSLLDTFLYFDYFRVSANFIGKFQEFGGFHYGSISLSNIWYYVPRTVYPNKPFGYGQMQVAEFLFPGAAEQSGFTPGFMQWVAGYADFGIFGVILYGVCMGFYSKGAYEYFLQNRNILGLTLMAQMGFIYYIEMFPNAPFPVFFLWLLVQTAFIRTMSKCEQLLIYRSSIKHI